MTYRIPKDKIPCKHLSSWSENQSPLGSGLYWPEYFEACTLEGKIDELQFSDEELYNQFTNGEIGCKNCPLYEPIPTEVCPKHDYEFLETDGCSVCEEDEFNKMMESDN